MDFEESLRRLENMAAQIKDNGTSLEDAIKCYEEGMKCYTRCAEILTEAEQKIEVYTGEKNGQDI